MKELIYRVIHQVLLLLMDYVQYGHRTKKRYMEVHLQEDPVQLLLKYLQVAYQMNQPLGSLLNSHVTSVMRLSIREALKQHRIKEHNNNDQ